VLQEHGPAGLFSLTKSVFPIKVFFMKKLLTYAIILAILPFTACGQNADVSKSGVTSAASLITLLPETIQGIIMMDVNRLMMTEFANKTINEKDNVIKYQNFISETGLDPRKDIYWIAIALSGLPEKNDQERAAVISMNYDRKRLLAKIKQEQPGMGETTYSGVTVHTGMKGSGDTLFSGAFLDDTRAVFGDEAMVKAVIDVHQKKEDNVLKNRTLSALIEETNQKAMVWSAITISPDDMKNAAARNPMMHNFEGINAMTLFFDYYNQMLDMEIKILGGDQDKNRHRADMLTGLRALGAGAAAGNPDMGEFLNRIDILAAPDFVTIRAKVPEDLIQRLSTSLSKKNEGMQ
jgi:hypothetical protein